MDKYSQDISNKTDEINSLKQRLSNIEAYLSRVSNTVKATVINISKDLEVYDILLSDSQTIIRNIPLKSNQCFYKTNGYPQIGELIEVSIKGSSVGEIMSRINPRDNNMWASNNNLVSTGCAI